MGPPLRRGPLLHQLKSWKSYQGYLTLQSTPKCLAPALEILDLHTKFYFSFKFYCAAIERPLLWIYAKSIEIVYFLHLLSTYRICSYVKHTWFLFKTVTWSYCCIRHFGQPMWQRYRSLYNSWCLWIQIKYSNMISIVFSFYSIATNRHHSHFGIEPLQQCSETNIH